MIGSSTGEQYETDYDVTIGRPVGASTEPADAFKVAGGTNPTPEEQKAIDELVAAAPNFANNPVIDQMSAAAERSRPEPPITASPNPKAPGSASAAQDSSDSSEVAARPRDPSIDSFIDRYGVWNIHDQIKKDEEDYRIQNEMTRDNKMKFIRPGSKSWPSGNTIL